MKPKDQPKYCKDCRYYTKPVGVIGRAHDIYLCGHPEAGYSLVDGEPAHPCMMVRVLEEMCGGEGKWFEGKEE